jgi:hypothetical protein
MTRPSKLFRLRPLPKQFSITVIRSNRTAAKPCGDESFAGNYRLFVPDAPPVQPADPKSTFPPPAI